MAVTFDAGSSSGTTNAGTSPLTWTHTCGASATALYIGVAVGQSGTSDSTVASGVSATYNGVSMTAVTAGQSSGNTGLTGTSGFIKVFKLASPATGANTVSVSFGTLSSGAVDGTGISVQGAVGGEGTPVTGFAQGVTTMTATVASTSTGNLCLAFLADGSGGEAWTAGTQAGKADNTGANANATAAGSTSSAYRVSAAGSTALTATFTTDWYGAIAFEVQALAGTNQPGPPLYPEYMQSTPALIITNAGWRGANHSLP